ncbi:putative holin [Yokenella regensburgei]|uniref:putative holin n=1 Tax=Yokenella regensburgei TaxID=158877 RepID=UPI003ED882F4
MSDPLTVAGGIAAGSVGVTLATMFPEATPGVMLFSLGGAALYVLTSEPHQIWKQAIFAIISFLGGVSFAVPMATIMAGVINSALSLLTPPVTIEVSPNIGALVAASISVAILLRILSKSKNGSFPRLDGGDE